MRPPIARALRARFDRALKYSRIVTPAMVPAFYRASCGGAGGGIDVNEVYRMTERSGTAQISPAETGRVNGPKRSGNRRVWPVALHLRIEADSAARTRVDSRPKTQLAGAARASGPRQRDVQERPSNRSEEPEIEQKRAEHPKTLEHAQGMFGIEADEHSGQDNYQEPADAVSNLQLQLEVLPHTHVSIVRAWTLIRSLSHPGDVTSRRHVGIWLRRHEVAAAQRYPNQKLTVAV
jgi:hypothetical protein